MEIEKLKEENEALKAIIEGRTQEDDCVGKFLEEFPQAEDFADEIGEVLAETGETDEAGLQKAYLKVLTRHFRKPEDLAKDEEFLKNNVYPDEKIRDFFVKEYLDSCANAPVGMFVRGGVPVSEENKPKTIASAGEMARALFRK